jgi:hypothetical protein
MTDLYHGLTPLGELTESADIELIDRTGLQAHPDKRNQYPGSAIPDLNFPARRRRASASGRPSIQSQMQRPIHQSAAFWP